MATSLNSMNSLVYANYDKRIVEFHTVLRQGIIVFRVIMSLPTTRIMMYSQSHTGEYEPVSFFIDDIAHQINLAEKILKGESSAAIEISRVIPM